LDGCGIGGRYPKLSAIKSLSVRRSTLIAVVGLTYIKHHLVF